jgi:eukaryotic-like serine/threonine-protein kinase
MTAPTAEDLPRLGRYQVLNKLAQGGMAEIFLAKALGVMGFERLVAIKLIHSQLTRDSEFVKMFIDEARIAMHLQHRNIVQVFDLDKAGDTYFIAMEYVHGVNLYDVYEKIAARGRWFDLPLALYIVAEVSKGLHFAHTRLGPDGRPLGIVHRDISPQNVLLSFEGEVKITDFGIAKAAERLHVTTPGIVKGKYAYMAPEILREKKVDGRADVFAAGVLLYELLVGENPYAGATPVQTIENVMHKVVPAPSQRGAYVSSELDQITLMALAKDPDERYANAAEFAEALTDHGLNLTSARRDIASGDSTISALLQELFPEKAKRAPLTAAPGSVNLPLVAKVQNPGEDTFPEEKMSAAIDPSMTPAGGMDSRAGDGEVDSTLLNLNGRRPASSQAQPRPQKRYNSYDEPATAELRSTDNTDPVKLDYEPATDRNLRALGRSATGEPVIVAPEEDFESGDPTVLNSNMTPSEPSPPAKKAGPGANVPASSPRPSPQHLPMPIVQSAPSAPAQPHQPPHAPHPPTHAPSAPEPFQQSKSGPQLVVPVLPPVGPNLEGVLNRPPTAGAPQPGAPAEADSMSKSKSMLLGGIAFVAAALVVLIIIAAIQRFSGPTLIPIRISSTPPGAQALVDGQDIGEPTPTEILLKDGETHVLELRMPGHKSFKKDVLPLKGVTSQVDAVLEPITGSIAVKVDPPDAVLSVNGVSKGPAPAKIENLLVGQDVVLKFERQGYVAKQETVSLTEASPNASVTVTLQKSP